MAEFERSTHTVRVTGPVPRHIAIIMDGNGRWAHRRHLPRLAGHQRGVEAVRRTVAECLEQGVEYLTLFAFSTENWRRPAEEVSFLQRLFIDALRRQSHELHEQGICFKVVGDLARLEPALVRLIQEEEAEALTVGVNYGGRWDILQAVRRLLGARPELAAGFGEEDLAPFWASTSRRSQTSAAHQQLPDLAARLHRAVLHRDPVAGLRCRGLELAIRWYAQRERRFGRTSEQLRSGRGVGQR